MSLSFSLKRMEIKMPLYLSSSFSGHEKSVTKIWLGHTELQSKHQDVCIEPSSSGNCVIANKSQHMLF